MEIWQVSVTLLSFYCPYQHPLLLLSTPSDQLYLDFLLQQQYPHNLMGTLITDTYQTRKVQLLLNHYIFKFGTNMILQPCYIQIIGKLVLKCSRGRVYTCITKMSRKIVLYFPSVAAIWVFICIMLLSQAEVARKTEHETCHRNATKRIWRLCFHIGVNWFQSISLP